MTAPPTCVDCGGPRSAQSGQRCRTCYRLRAALRKFAHDAGYLGDALAALAALRAKQQMGGAAQMALVALALEDIGEHVLALSET